MKSRIRDSFAVEVGRRLQITREASGLSQAELARLLEVDQMRLSNWELGKHMLPPTYMRKACAIMHGTADWCYLGSLYGVPDDLKKAILEIIKKRGDGPDAPPPIKPNPRHFRR